MTLDDLTSKSLSNNRGGPKAVYSPVSIDWIVSCEWKLHASQVTTVFDMLTDLLTLTLANLVLPRYGQAEISPHRPNVFFSPMQLELDNKFLRFPAKCSTSAKPVFCATQLYPIFPGKTPRYCPQPSHIPFL